MTAGQMAMAADPALLQIRILEGDGQIYATGSRATRGLTIQITNETGQPVETATVSFRLPDSGPTGTFASGTRTEIVTTKADGVAAIWGMQWNKTAGPLVVKITAAKGGVRAGATAQFVLSDSLPAVSKSGMEPRSSKKWLMWTAIIGGGAVAGMAAAKMGGSSSTVSAPAAATVRIGNPSISLGRP
jgi:hypothetical protein